MSHPTAIVVFTGGYSGEAVISRKSARMVMNNIDRKRFDPVLIHIDEEGWFEETASGKIQTSLDQLLSDDRGFIGGFIMVHGTPGEDGKLQSMLEQCGFKHTTGDHECMALTFNKGRTTAALKASGIPVADSVQIPSGTNWEVNKIADSIGLPCFVKPNETGSSIGINRAESLDELDAAINAAQAIGDSGVLIESLLVGREFTVGIVPDAHGHPQALPVTEIRTHRKFFDFTAKYDGESEEITPADIDLETSGALQKRALEVYQVTRCKGMARVDMIWLDNQKAAVIEINTVPGFSEASIIPKQAEAVGMSKTELISRIIDQTLLT